MVLFCKPRVCGEKKLRSVSTISAIGSPPRMRGKAMSNQVATSVERITPAYAGKRPPAQMVFPPKWDHPRVCGEKKLTAAPAVAVLGSPPRMRGKGLLLLAGSAARGITPAYAGKSTSGMLFLSCSWDHPRVCGEKCNSYPLQGTKEGSPPRMRGKVVKVDRHKVALGITPAYAGKSRRSCT